MPQFAARGVMSAVLCNTLIYGVSRAERGRGVGSQRDAVWRSMSQALRCIVTKHKHGTAQKSRKNKCSTAHYCCVSVRSVR